MRIILCLRHPTVPVGPPAWGKFWPKNRALTDDELTANLARNGDWIRQKIRDGYVVVDIGTETPGTFSSPFYLLERLILDANDYPVVGLGGF